MPAPRVRLVVLNYNGGDLTLRCVDHLERLDWPADALEIVVVDNASTDGSAEKLDLRSRVRLVQAGANLGFPANNLGMRDLDGVDFVGLVNNDAFVEPDYLRPLVAALGADGSIGAACPKILLAPGFVDLRVEVPTVQVAGDPRDLGLQVSGLEVDGVDRWRQAIFADGWHLAERGADTPELRWSSADAQIRVPVARDAAEPLPPARLRLSAPQPVTAWIDNGDTKISVDLTAEPRWVDVALAGEPYDVINNVGSRLVEGGWGGDRGFLEPDLGQYDEAQDVFAWCGAGVLFPVAYLRDVGLFDERFFLYYEDTDMSWRGRARGWRYRYVPEAVARHVHAASSVEGSPLFHHYVERNRLAMLTKNAPPRLAAGAAGRFLLSTASYARRDVVRPVLGGHRPNVTLVKARLAAFADYVRMVPGLLGDRRRLRAAQQVHDEAVTGWAVPQ